jgi:hypothetical protein
MKIFSVLLLIVGLILAPAYWIYAKFYTGKQSAMLVLDRVDGVEKANPLWRSAPFQLQADMAPAGLILHVKVSFPSTTDVNQPRQDRYNIILHKDGVVAKPLLITLKAAHSAEGPQEFKEHLLFMQVVQAGSYQVEVKPASVSVMKVEQMNLAIWQNLQEPDSGVVTGGIVMLVLGLLGLIAI